MTERIPDFSADERARVEDLLVQRYGRPVGVELADGELQLAPGGPLVSCPALCWTERGANFVVCKVGAGRYRCQFFYADAEQYGTGRAEYSDLGECVLTLLRVQSDHERERARAVPGAAAGDAGRDDHTGPGFL